MVFSMQLSNNQFVVPYKKITEEFCKVYYDRMMKGGFNTVLHLFDQNAKCTYENTEYNGAYNLLIKLAQSGIHKFGYTDISVNAQLIDNTTILVSSTGHIFPVSFCGTNGLLTKFSESFVLKCTSNSCQINNYILKLTFN